MKRTHYQLTVIDHRSGETARPTAFVFEEAAASQGKLSALTTAPRTDALQSTQTVLVLYPSREEAEQQGEARQQGEAKQQKPAPAGPPASPPAPRPSKPPATPPPNGTPPSAKASDPPRTEKPSTPTTYADRTQAIRARLLEAHPQDFPARHLRAQDYVAAWPAAKKKVALAMLDQLEQRYRTRIAALDQMESELEEAFRADGGRAGVHCHDLRGRWEDVFRRWTRPWQAFADARWTKALEEAADHENHHAPSTLFE